MIHATSAMPVAASDEIYCQLIPLHGMRLIVPRVCVAEVVRHHPLERRGGEAAWFRGFLQWRALKVPVLSFEMLCGREAAEAGGRTRIVLFNTLSDRLESGYYGLLTEGFPQLVRVNRSVIQPDERQDWPLEGPVISQVRMINEYPLIPDLPYIEGKLRDCLAGGMHQLS